MNPESIAEFARRHIATRPELGKQEAFPCDVWSAMGQSGLLGLFLPREYGGGGADCAQFVRSGEAFVRAGGNLGMAMAWFGHSAVARFFLAGFGNAEQQAAWLPGLASGSATASVAISEPGAGAHPKHLRAQARREGDSFYLTGEKFYVTNGNIARLFLVLAITDRSGGRKRYSLFLVPRDSAGLKVEAMPPLDYLRPSQHVRLLLADCRVPARGVLGARDGAYEAMARPFRDVEDILGAGPLLGAMSWQMEALLAHLREAARAGQREAEQDKGGQDKSGQDTVEQALGDLDTRLAACRVLAGEAARLLDADLSAGRPAGPEAARLSLATRAAMRGFQEAMRQAREVCNIAENAALDAITHELARVAGAPGKVALLKQRKIGAALLSQSP